MLKSSNSSLKLEKRQKFAAEHLPLHNSPDLHNELIDLFALIRGKFSHSSLIKELQQVFDYTVKILEVAPLYDFSPSVQANGYWTFGQFVVKFFRLALYSIEKKWFNVKIFLSAAQVLNISLKFLNELIQQDAEGVSNYCLFSSKQIEVSELFENNPETREALIDYFSNFNGFYHSSDTMLVIERTSIFLSYIYCMNTKFRITRNIFSRRQRSKMILEMALKGTLKNLKRGWSTAESPIGYQMLNSFTRCPKSVRTRQVLLPVQERWRISADEHSTVYDLASMTPEEQKTKKMATQAENGVPCLLVESKKHSKITCDENRVVFLHVHGGGFSSTSPKSHRNYLQDWVDKYPGMSIISVDYRHTPEYPFPAAFQDVLDVYLELVQPFSACQTALGFRPSKIAFVGDSAGANLLVSLCIALDSMKNRLEEFIPPVAIFSFYGAFMLPKSSPSKVIAFNDGFLHIGPILACMDGYINVSQKNIEEFIQAASNPFISPLLSENFDFSKEIPLHLFVGHYDFTLDDSVEMAKRWQGAVRFVVLPDVPHGFLNLINQSKQCKKTNNLCAEHFAQLFE